MSEQFKSGTHLYGAKVPTHIYDEMYSVNMASLSILSLTTAMIPIQSTQDTM